MNYRLGSRNPTEFRLLAECCRWNFAGGDGGEIRKFGRNPNWRVVLKLARRHRVQRLVQRCLWELRAAVPIEVASELAEDSAVIAKYNLRAARQSGLLLQAFNGAGIPLIFVKGLTLSKLAYGDAFVKMSDDIDVLVPGDTITDSATVLNRLGYSLVIPAPRELDDFRRWHRTRKESVWRSPDGLSLELHSRLADSPHLIPGVGVASRVQQVEVAPGIALPTLARDELFAYLCVHGASSAWFRLKWITDLAAFVHGCSAEEMERLYERSQQLRAGRAAAQALLLAARTFQTTASGELERKLARTFVNCKLANAAWRQMHRVREPTETRFGTASIHITQLFLLPGSAFKLRELARQVSDVISRHP